MRKWMRDRMKRRNKPGQNPEAPQDANTPAPLQPTFLDRDSGEWAAPAESGREAEVEASGSKERKPDYESQPEHDPMDTPDEPEEAASDAKLRGGRSGRSRRRGRGGRGRRTPQQQAAAQSATPVLPIEPGAATGEAAEVDGVVPETPAVEPAPMPEPQQKKTKAPRGAVVLAIGLPGSGKSSWFRRHNIIPLSSDLVRGLLFDDPTEQRFQDLVFSTLRYMLRMRLVAGRPMNFIDATNLSPKERHSWIKMAKDYNYEAHAVFFDVPTEVCMERNRKRSRNVPDDVMLRMAQKLRPPKFDEGFAKVTIVRLKKAEKREGSPEPFADPEE